MGPGGTSLLWPHNPRSQVPDLNGSIAALQAAAWPLRQLGTVISGSARIEETCTNILEITVYLRLGLILSGQYMVTSFG